MIIVVIIEAEEITAEVAVVEIVVAETVVAVVVAVEATETELKIKTEFTAPYDSLTTASSHRETIFHIIFVVQQFSSR